MFLRFSAGVIASAAVWDFEVLDVTDAVYGNNSMSPTICENCSCCVDVERDLVLIETTSTDDDDVGGVVSSSPYCWLVVRSSF